MTTMRTCSWRDRWNLAGEQWCGACGHRADRPRMACDCRMCRPGPGAYVDVTPREPSPN